MSWGLVGALVVGLGIVVKVVTAGWWGYLPPGFTGVIVALVVVWREEVPRLYGVRVVSGWGADTTGNTRGESGGESNRTTQVGGNSNEVGFIFSDRFITYIMAAQLALSQFPYQLLPAFIGWAVGVAWREESLPTSMMRWRIPAWVVGESNVSKGRGQYEGLRRRLEEEGSGRDGMREVSDRAAEDQQTNRRGLGQRVLSYFTG